MSIRPTLAVVVPAWNAVRFLPAMFDAFDAQVEPFDEVIVVDDASSDDTAALAAARGAGVVRHARNAGCSAAKNTGLAAVRADWVHFHDADELLAPDFVRLARRRIAAGAGFDALLFDVEYRDGATGGVIARSALDPAALARDAVAFMLGHTVNNCGVYRVECVRAMGGFRVRPETLHNEDRAFHLALAEAGARFAVESTAAVVPRRFAGSMSQANAVRCLLAHAVVTTDYMARQPGRHSEACARALWQAATGLASHRRFDVADDLVARAAALGYPVDPAASPRFAALCRLGPRVALRAREYAIRAFKPWLRRA